MPVVLDLEDTESEEGTPGPCERRRKSPAVDKEKVSGRGGGRPKKRKVEG